MDDRFYLDVISEQRKGFVAGLIRTGLSATTPVYQTLIECRNRLFDVGLKPSHRLGVPVISVGNITTGGTGKTPLVAWLVNRLTSRGRRPALVSRGYRSLDERGNDERLVLQQLCPSVPHEQDRDRVRAARRAIETHAVDVVILDDGFQHRRLARDLDLVLIDALNPWGYGRMLPRGLLREPKSSLQRADAVLITRVDHCPSDTLSRLRAEIRSYTSAPVAEVAFRPQQLRSIEGQRADLAMLTEKQLLGFCGIGNPDSFRGTLATAGFSPADVPVEVFPDHHYYVAEDIGRIEDLADAHQAEAFVTTQKDLVKLNAEWFEQRPVWAVVIGAEFVHGEAAIAGLLASAIGETAGGSDE